MKIKEDSKESATFSKIYASTNSWKYEANKKLDSPYRLKMLNVDL